MTNYSTLQDVRDFGVAVADASDARVTTSLGIAKKKIDDYVGYSFATPASGTHVVENSVKGWVPLPTFSAITAVTVNDILLDSGMYEVRSYGIKFKQGYIIDADGFRVTFWPTYQSIHPVVVKVTATYGKPVDDTIALASTMLAAGLALLTADDLLPAAQIASTDAGGVKITQQRTGFQTTGNLEVDAVLDGGNYLDATALVD